MPGGRTFSNVTYYHLGGAGTKEDPALYHYIYSVEHAAGNINTTQRLDPEPPRDRVSVYRPRSVKVLANVGDINPRRIRVRLPVFAPGVAGYRIYCILYDSSSSGMQWTDYVLLDEHTFVFDPMLYDSEAVQNAFGIFPVGNVPELSYNITGVQVGDDFALVTEVERWEV